MVLCCHSLLLNSASTPVTMLPFSIISFALHYNGHSYNSSFNRCHLSLTRCLHYCYITSIVLLLDDPLMGLFVLFLIVLLSLITSDSVTIQYINLPFIALSLQPFFSC